MDKNKARASRRTPQEPASPIAAQVRQPIDWRQHGLVAMLLCVALLAAYSNCFGTGLLYDNDPVVREDPRIRAVTSQNIDAIWSTGYWFNNQDPTLYRPLTTFSYLFNYAVLGNGANPTGYHWFNLLLHCVNVMLVYVLGLVLFPRKTIQAAALAALWGLHPILTESVTNIVGRADLISAFGVLTALLCHIQAASETGARRVAWLAGVLAGSIIAVYSKESGVVLIALLLVYDWLFRKSSLRACVAGYAATLTAFAFFFYLRAGVLAALPASAPQFVNNPLVGAGFLQGRLTAIQIIGRYLSLLVWPQALSCDYSYNQIPIFRGTFNNWADWASALALIVCLGAAWIAVAWQRRNPVVAFGIAIFFIALSPGANIAFLLVTIMAERFMYLPSVGFMLCVVWAMYAAAQRLECRSPQANHYVVWVIGVICLALLLRTHARNADWDNARALWTSTTHAAPNSYKGYMNLATEDFKIGGPYLDRSIAEGRQALSILHGLSPEKDDPLTYANLGAYDRVKGDAVRNAKGPDAAQQSLYWYQQSLEILLHGAEVDRARSEESERAQRDKGRPIEFMGMHQIYQELGQTYIRLNQPQKAVDALDFGALLKPTDEILKLTSLAYIALYRQDDAAMVLWEGLLLQPSEKAYASELLNLYQKRNPPTCAVERTAAGVNLNFGCPLVHDHVCGAVSRLEDYFTRRHQPADVAKMRAMGTQSFSCPVQ